MIRYKNIDPMLDSALIGCKATIERTYAVQTGVISFLEGELFEVELAHYKYFDPGNTVSVVIYSPEGIIRFDTSVLAKGMDCIILLTPPFIQNSLLKKRQFPRLKVQESGLIYSITDPALNSKGLESCEPIEITNLSQGGLGFVTVLDIPERVRLDVELQIDSSFLCAVEIIHFRMTDEGREYGGRFLDLSPQQSNTLRAFMLRRRIEQRFEAKKSKFIENTNSDGGEAIEWMRDTPKE